MRIRVALQRLSRLNFAVGPQGQGPTCRLKTFDVKDLWNKPLEQTFTAEVFQVGEDEFGSLNAWLGGRSDNGVHALWFNGAFPRENGSVDRKQFYIEFNEQSNGRQQRRFQQYVSRIELTSGNLQIHFSARS